MSLTQASNTPLPSHLLEINNAWLIVPHDDAWKRILVRSLLEIGGTDQELQTAYDYVKDKLMFENIKQTGSVNQQ